MSFADTDYANTNFDANNQASNQTIDPINRRDELFVGSGLKVKLEVSVCDTFNLEGDVEGKVKARHMFMSDTAKFVGDAEVDSATIDGSFDGSLTVLGLLQVGKTGKINGTLRYKEIEIARSGQLRGNIDTINSAAKQVLEAAIDPVKKTVEQILADVSSKHKDDHQPAHKEDEHASDGTKTEEKPKKFFF